MAAWPWAPAGCSTPRGQPFGAELARVPRVAVAPACLTLRGSCVRVSVRAGLLPQFPQDLAQCVWKGGLPWRHGNISLESLGWSPSCCRPCVNDWL